MSYEVVRIGHGLFAAQNQETKRLFLENKNRELVERACAILNNRAHELKRREAIRLTTAPQQATD